MTAIQFFRTNVKRLMEEKGISASELARLTGMPRSNVSVYLSGVKDPSVPTIQRIAIALDTTPAELLKEQDEETHLYFKPNPSASKSTEIAYVSVNPEKSPSDALEDKIIAVARLAGRMAAEEAIKAQSSELKDATHTIETLKEIVELQKKELIAVKSKVITQSTLSPVRLDFTNLIAASPLDDSQLEDLLDAIREPLLGELHEPKQKKRTR